MPSKPNWIALIVAAAAGMAIGFLFYGVLFTDLWMAGNGLSLDGKRLLKNGVEVPSSPLPMIVNGVSLLVYAFLIHWLTVKTSSFTFRSGATLGAVLGLISFFGIYTANRFAARPTSLSMVDGTYTLILFIVMGGIIGGWRSSS